MAFQRPAAGAVAILETSASWLGDKIGDDAKAEVYISNLIFGILRELDKNDAGVLRAEREALATPNTLNLQMVEGLDAAGVYDAVHDMHEKILKSMEVS